MTFNPLAERGIPLERQLRNWSELNVTPYRSEDVHPYTRCRVIVMNGVEVEAVMFSHNFNRNCADVELKQRLQMVRRIEQQQQKAVNWLIPGEAEENVFEVTIGYEQVAVDLTAWLARNEPDPYLRQVYEFGLLEDFDHLYRYANLMDLMGNGRKAEAITGGLTDITPGRPTIFEHRDPRDDIRRPMTVTAAHRQSILNTMTLVAAEQQTMNYYMTAGNRPTDPLARAVYLEIAQIEEQHVSHYESCLDPTMSWLTNWLMHENHECWMYWSFLETETDPRIRQVWETHLAMELEHLRIAAQALEEIEGKDAAELLGPGFDAPMTFEDNKAYLKEVVATQVDLTSWDSVFVPIDSLPEGHRYFAYQAQVNAGGVPTEQVIDRHRAEFGGEYRDEDTEHPVPSLQEAGPHEDLGYWRAARTQGAPAEPVAQI
jgi:rubrerythrin